MPPHPAQGHPARIIDTRKTAPGMRVLDKWAVRIGGGSNHRIGLYDMVMIKNNHIAAAGGVAAAVRCCQARALLAARDSCPAPQRPGSSTEAGLFLHAHYVGAQQPGEADRAQQPYYADRAQQRWGTRAMFVQGVKSLYLLCIKLSYFVVNFVLIFV